MLPIEKLVAIKRRREELDQLLCDPAVIADTAKLQELNRERSHVGTIVEVFDEWSDLDKRIREDREALSDPELGPLAEEELPGLAKELNGLLDWVEQLNAVDTAGVEPMTSVVAVTLPMREDAVTEGGIPDKVLGNAPERTQGFYAVPKVVE